MRTTRIIIMFLFLMLCTNTTYALETDSHKLVNERAAINSKIDSYFQSELKMLNILDAPFGKRNALGWLTDGGVYEDKPLGIFNFRYLRSRNHFYNPLNGSGFTDWTSACGINECPVSVLLWAKFTQPPDVLNAGGDWSLGRARDFYLAALTGNSTPLNGYDLNEEYWSRRLVGKTNLNEAERKEYFGLMFRSGASDASCFRYERSVAHEESTAHQQRL